MSQKYQLYDLLLTTSEKGCLLQKENGSMSPGHNGVRLDPETPVRNTGHWLITFLKAYDISGDKRFLVAAEHAVDYLLGKDARPMNASFWHRFNPEKDFCNGVMGQAYTIEALAIAYHKMGIEKALKVAEEVFLLHPFDEKLGIWRSVAVDGSFLGFDFTFNHQLWFAASGALLVEHTKNALIKERIDIFMNLLPNNINLYNDGLIKHLLITEPHKKLLNKFGLLLSKNKVNKRRHAIGYHQFNMYAMGILKQIFTFHPFWDNKKFKAALKYMQSDSYKRLVEDESFSDPFCPAGFDTSFIERAYVLEVFENDQRLEQERLVSEQFRRSFDFESNLLIKRTKDPNTQAARIYKATRLPNLTLVI